MNFMSQSLILFSLCFISFCVNAQKLEYFSNQDHINDLFFDEDRIWVATDGGLLELDMNVKLLKKHTVLDGLKHTILSLLRKNDNGKLCAIRPSSGTVFIYDNNQWKEDKSFRKNKPIKIIYSNNIFGYVNLRDQKIHLKENKKWKKFQMKSKGYYSNESAIYDNEGNLWIGVKEGLARFQKKEPQIYRLDSTIYSIDCLLKDKKGVLWALDKRKAWYSYDQQKDTWEICKNDQWNMLLESPINYTDVQGNLWFVNKEGNLLYKYNGSSWKEIKVPVAEVIKNWQYKDGLDKLKHMAEDKAGNLWFASINGNLYKYDGKEWKNFNLLEKESLFKGRGMYTNSVFKDKKGNIWLSGNNGTTYYDLEQTKDSYTNQEAFKIQNYNSISTNLFIEDEQENIYSNGYHSIHKYDRKKAVWSDVSVDEKVHYFHYDKEKKAMSYLTQSGMLMNEFSSGEIYYEKLTGAKESDKENDFKAIHWDSKGGVWIAFNDKLHYSTSEKTLVFDPSNSPITEDAVDFIFEDSKGRIWTNTKEGTAYWNGESWINFDRHNSLLDGTPILYENKNIPITEDKEGNILIRGYHSISIWNGEKWSKNRQWDKYLSYRGALYTDQQGVLWLLNNKKGIVRCEGLNCKQVVSSKIEFFDLIEDKKGRIWFFTKFDGFFRYTPIK
jgi:ligand-binding sensor domain-containing protein